LGFVEAGGSHARVMQNHDATQSRHSILDVIVTAGPQAVHALMDTQTKTPIVFAIVGDPSATASWRAWRVREGT
jgi:ABC-type uncharacterized transport system substrate-binding protein